MVLVTTSPPSHITPIVGMGAKALTPPSGAVFFGHHQLHATVVGRSVSSPPSSEGGLLFDWGSTCVTFTTIGSSYVLLEMNSGKAKVTCEIKRSDRGSTSETIVLDKKARRCYLSKDLPVDVEVTFTLQRRNEPVAGGLRPTELLGIHLEATGTIVAPSAPSAPPRRRHIEFVGDSDTAGYGNIGKTTSLYNIFSGYPSDQDTNQAWPAVVARTFDADHTNISYSGIGAVFNAPIPGFTNDTMFDLYPRLICMDASTDTSSSSSCAMLPPTDCVVVYLGGNDYWTFASKKEKEVLFVEGFVRFLLRVRELRGEDVPIVVLLCDERSGSCLGTAADQQKYSETMERTLRNAVDGAGGGIHVKCVDCSKDPIVLGAKGAWGSNAHWSAASHVLWSKGVAVVLAEVMGWAAGGEVKCNL